MEVLGVMGCTWNGFGAVPKKRDIRSHIPCPKWLWGSLILEGPRPLDKEYLARAEHKIPIEAQSPDYIGIWTLKVLSMSAVFPARCCVAGVSACERQDEPPFRQDFQRLQVPS